MVPKRYPWIASCFVAALSLSQAAPVVAQSRSSPQPGADHLQARLSLQPITDGLKGESLFSLESRGRTVATGQVRRGDQPVMIAVRLKIDGIDDELIFRLEKDPEFVHAVLHLGALRGEIRADPQNLQELPRTVVDLERLGRSGEARAVQARGIVQVIGDFEVIRQKLASSEQAAPALDAIRAVSREHRARNLTDFALQNLAHLITSHSGHDPSTDAFRPVANRMRIRHSSAYHFVQTPSCPDAEDACFGWFALEFGGCSLLYWWCTSEEWFGPNSWFDCGDLWSICVLVAYYDYVYCLCNNCPEKYKC
ncbi:MAG TPA: hypothetical protein VER58_10920 [Thermoanaerobaculia bacterium]|nr:hypothetical protein [Thermoanaerobaculia bacterium]